MRKIAFTLFSLLVLATTATAQMRHPGMMNPGGGTPGATMGGPMHFVVAPDGTVITIERSGTTANIVAFTATGTKAWTYPLTPTGMGQFELAGTLVVIADDDALVALQLSNGAKAWSVDLGGDVMAIESAPNQLYAMVIKNADRQRMMGQGARELVAVSLTGTVLWRQGLD